MKDDTFVAEYLDHFAAVMYAEDLNRQLRAAKEALVRIRENCRRVMLAGNGASASIASHYALDFTKQAGIPSISFNDAPLVTAYGNDYGFERWVAEAIGHHGRAGDAAVLISTSGSSPNMVRAADRCRELGITTLTFTGFESANPLRERGDINFWVASRSYNVVEAVHALWLGLLCDLIIGKREYAVKG